MIAAAEASAATTASRRGFTTIDTMMARSDAPGILRPLSLLLPRVSRLAPVRLAAAEQVVADGRALGGNVLSG